jgi:hypothetical protein
LSAEEIPAFGRRRNAQPIQSVSLQNCELFSYLADKTDRRKKIIGHGFSVVDRQRMENVLVPVYRSFSPEKVTNLCITT